MFTDRQADRERTPEPPAVVRPVRQIVMAANVTGSGVANSAHRGLVIRLAIIFAAVFAWSAWYPKFPLDWLLENVLVVVATTLLIWIYQRVPFSRASWILAFLFLSVHEIGAHWTYSEVPYRQLLGLDLSTTRNHFDRLVHFLYGLLLVWPMRNLLISLRVVPERSASFFAINLILSTSTVYELAEWLVGEFMAAELAAAYLGMLGDIWDAQKDIALAGVGAVIAIGAGRIFARFGRRAAIASR